MKIEVDTLQPKKASLFIHDSEIYLMNSLRRIMLSELPKLAIANIVIYDNTSALFDEIISHRLGLIPIPTDASLLNYRDECVCKGAGCPNCTVRYTLSKEGEGMVRSGDLQSSEDSWRIKEDKIPIVELFSDQRLILEVEAVLGKGLDHAKWISVISPGYRFIPIITYDEKRKTDVEELVSALPKGLVTIKKNTLELDDISHLPILESYINRENIDFITITLDDKDINFHFETDGAIETADALQQSIELFEGKLKEFGGLVKKMK